MSDTLTLSTLREATRSAVAIRAILRLQPAGGPGSTVFPPTYANAQDGKDGDRFQNTKYATELRRIDGEKVNCVLLDSVASQANRMELALLEGWRSGDLAFPLVRVDFSAAEGIERVTEVTTLDAPHRIYDAILRDAVDAEGTLFRYTAPGKAVTDATHRDATALYTYCPTALIFGAWDSTGPKGGLGSKFQRAVSSEIVGIGAELGTKVGGRIDPLGIVSKAGPVFKSDSNDGWSFDAPTAKDKGVRPSEVNHGNIAPTRDMEAGGVTIDHARQTTVISLPALRRIKFTTTVDGSPTADRKATELAARTALAALAVAGVATAHAEGHDLRSGALLVGEGPLSFEIVQADGSVQGPYVVTADDAAALLAAANEAAAAVGMGWQKEPIPTLKPAPKLVQLLSQSQNLEAKQPQGDNEED